ncbi:MAG: phosphate transport system protein [Oceanospirillaceae bacterium]|jgi:phosphate transport system protein
MNITNKDGHVGHISQQFNAELDEIRTHLMAMGGMIEQQLKDAMVGLKTGDTALLQTAIKADDQINTLEMHLDDQCARIIARRQPAASDLRLVIAISKAVTDLERMGDEICRIANSANKLIADFPGEGYLQVRHIGDLVATMVSDSLTAFARYDAGLAYHVAKRDDEVDKEYKFAMRALVTQMMEEPGTIQQCMHIIWMLRSLERVGDHAQNVAQHLIYLVKGINVSHSSVAQMHATLDLNN